MQSQSGTGYRGGGGGGGGAKPFEQELWNIALLVFGHQAVSSMRFWARLRDAFQFQPIAQVYPLIVKAAVARKVAKIEDALGDDKRARRTNKTQRHQKAEQEEEAGLPSSGQTPFLHPLSPAP